MSKQEGCGRIRRAVVADDDDQAEVPRRVAMILNLEMSKSIRRMVSRQAQCGFENGFRRGVLRAARFDQMPALRRLSAFNERSNGGPVAL